MKFVILLITLIADRSYGWHKPWRDFSWFGQWRQWLQHLLSFIPYPAVLVLVAILVPGFIFNAVFGFVSEFSWFVEAAFSVLVLLFCLGPLDLETDVENYLNAVKKHGSGGIYTDALLQGEMGTEESEQIQITRKLLTRAVEELFAVLFWFVLLGPVAAFVYRLVLQNYLDNQQNPVARYLLAMAVYFPAYLVTLSFALVGSFDDTVKKFREFNDRCSDLLERNRQLVLSSGCAALRMDSTPEENQEKEYYLLENARAIILRSLVVWFAFVLLVNLSRLSA